MKFYSILISIHKILRSKSLKRYAVNISFWKVLYPICSAVPSSFCYFHVFFQNAYVRKQEYVVFAYVLHKWQHVYYNTILYFGGFNLIIQLQNLFISEYSFLILVSLFLQLHTIPLYGRTIAQTNSHLLVDIWAVSSFLLSKTMPWPVNLYVHHFSLTQNICRFLKLNCWVRQCITFVAFVIFTDCPV